LEQSGLEECCDYITLTSIEDLEGGDSQMAVLSSTNQTATVKGPAVLVTFSSDDYEAGNGLQLGFSIETQMKNADADNNNPVVSYHRVHFNHA